MEVCAPETLSCLTTQLHGSLVGIVRDTIRHGGSTHASLKREPARQTVIGTNMLMTSSRTNIRQSWRPTRALPGASNLDSWDGLKYATRVQDVLTSNTGDWALTAMGKVLEHGITAGLGEICVFTLRGFSYGTSTYYTLGILINKQIARCR